MKLLFKSVSVPAVLRILWLLLVDMEVVLDSNLHLRMDGAIHLPVQRIEATALLAAEVNTNIGNEQEYRCWNCNNTDVPILFNAFVLPQPVLIPIYQDTWHLNITYDFVVLKDLNRLEASFNVQVISKDGYTELCYVLGDRCYVQDVCAKLSMRGSSVRFQWGSIVAPQQPNCQRYRSSSLESFWSPCTCGQKVYPLVAFSA